ncbi:MAG: GNAT family N-acetyltransferase [Alphaproteobacteria bacterium]|nr:GNAT family N-acetyltransferase [Alphaproteobacteria bacterium]
MLGYAPSLVVTGIVSLASLSLFTDFLTRAQFGQYALAITAMTMLVGVFFSWSQSAASRLTPQAVREGTEAKLYATLYAASAACALGVLAVAAFLIAFFPLGDWHLAAWFAPPLAILRAFLNINQSIHRNFIRITRYNIIEIGQSLVGLGTALALIILLHRGASGPVLGMLIGLALMTLFDWRMFTRIHWRDFDRKMFGEVAHFGLPFVANYAFSFILAGSDRFIIELQRGSDQVGIYSAGYAFPDRIGQYLFMAVATASLPLTVRRLEQEGVEAARDQTYTNGIAVLALAVPACIGMLLVNRQIAATFIGEAFRDGAIQVMPWITCAAILNGIAAHYFDHAFLLAKKTRLFFYTLGPAALLNLGVNWFWAIPHFGYMGAAYTTLASYALYLFLSIVIGRRAFPIKFPFKPALQIAFSAGLMAFILSAFDFPESWLGLGLMIAIGAAVYGAGLLAFDVMGMRSLIEARLLGLAPKAEFETLSNFAQVEAIAPEWRALYERAGHGVFGRFEWFRIWWDHLGQSGKGELRIVIARKDGKLVGVLPLAVRRGGVLRFVEYAGHEVFDYGDVLAENADVAAALWIYARQAVAHDIVLIKDVHEGALSLGLLRGILQQRDSRKNYFLRFDCPSGEAWLAAQSRKLRGDARRKTEKMQARGPVTLHVYKNGDPVPGQVIDALYAQKAAWFKARGASGVFSCPAVKGFLHGLAQDAASRGMLYLAWMSCGDTIVACHMGFIRSRVLHLYHTTYDADFGAFSPGNSMMIETIKSAIDAGLIELDFMRGDESYKQRFASGTRALAVFVAGGSLLGRAAVWGAGLHAAKTPEAEAPEESSEA